MLMEVNKLINFRTILWIIFDKTVDVESSLINYFD